MLYYFSCNPVIYSVEHPVDCHRSAKNERHIQLKNIEMCAFVCLYMNDKCTLMYGIEHINKYVTEAV